MWLAYILHICNVTAFRASTMVVALYAAQAGAGPVVLGTLFAASALAPVLLGIYAGRLCDRFGVRMPMLAGSAMIAAALALAAAVPGLPVQFVATTVIGAGYLFYMVAQQSMVGALSTPGTRARNFSNQTLIASIATFIGPLGAGFLIEHRGYAVAFGIFALLPAIAAAMLATGWAVRTCARARADLVAQGSEPPLDFLRHRQLLYMVVTSGLVLTCVDLFQFYAPLHAQSAGLTPSEIGAIMSAYAAAAIAVRTVMPQLIALCRHAERLLVIALLLAVIACTLFPLAGSAYLLAALAFLLGAGLGCAQPLSVMLTYDYSPPGRSGEGLGLRLVVSNAARLVLPLGLGPLSAAFGLLVVFWSKAGILVGSAMLTHRSQGKPSVEVEEVSAAR